MKNSGRLLTSAVLIAVTGSLCCIGPFLLLATGMTAAWMGNLMVLQAYQPLLSVVAISMAFFAAYQILRRKPQVAACESADFNGQVRQRVVIPLLSVLLVLVLSTSEYWFVMLAA